jgi:hypothetical protein
LSCPVFRDVTVVFPESAQGGKRPESISFGHCIPAASGISHLSSPITFCSLKANQLRARTPWHIWCAFRGGVAEHEKGA